MPTSRAFAFDEVQTGLGAIAAGWAHRDLDQLLPLNQHAG
jgi:4-aminobutyrate aminotransferase-like enzyme